MACEKRLGLQTQSQTQSQTMASSIPVISAELADAARQLLAHNPEVSHYYNCLKLLKVTMFPYTV